MSPAFNNPLAKKLKSPYPRGLADFTTGPKGPNDPRGYRAPMRAGAPKTAGPGLAVNPAGELQESPGASSLVVAAQNAGEGQLAEAGRLIALETPGPWGLDVNSTERTISNSVNEESFYQRTVDPNLLVGSRRLRLSLLGQMLNNGAARNVTVRVKLGGTTVYGDVMQPSGADIPSSANIRLVMLVLEFAALGSASSQMLWGKIVLGNSGAPTIAASGFIGSATPTSALDTLIGSNGPSAIDMSVAQSLEVTLQMNLASVNFTWTRRHALLEVY